jgi:hypothetical protein
MRQRHVLIDGTGGAGNCESRSFVVRCERRERVIDGSTVKAARPREWLATDLSTLANAASFSARAM